MDRIWDFDRFGKKVALIDDTGTAVRYDEWKELEDQLATAGDAGMLTMMICRNSIGALA